MLAVSAVVAAAKIAFNAASGAYLKALLLPVRTPRPRIDQGVSRARGAPEVDKLMSVLEA
jgi:hypothetical protein